MASTVFDRRVFQVEDPPCEKCHSGMDFRLYENYEGTGTDWVQWCCKNASCAFCFNVEIL